MSKGVIMEVGKRDCVVLTETGAFVRVSKRAGSPAVGDEITLPSARRSLPRRSWMMGSAAAAALLFVIIFSVLPGSFNPASSPAPDTAVAYVSIDINPSVELGIDENEQVVEVEDRNKDGEELLKDLSLLGLEVDDAVRLIMEKAESEVLSERASADIVITSVVVEDNAGVAEEALGAELKKEVQQVLIRHHKEELEAFRVTVWSAPSEVREAARTLGLSTGKMAFYLKANADGAQVTVDELKHESIHDVAERFKEKQLLSSERKFTKEQLKQLLKKEKEAPKEDRKNDKSSPPANDKQDDDDDAVDVSDNRDDKYGNKDDGKNNGKKDDKHNDKDKKHGNNGKANKDEGRGDENDSGLESGWRGNGKTGKDLSGKPNDDDRNDDNSGQTGKRNVNGGKNDRQKDGNDDGDDCDDAKKKSNSPGLVKKDADRGYGDRGKSNKDQEKKKD